MKKGFSILFALIVAATAYLLQPDLGPIPESIESTLTNQKASLGAYRVNWLASRRQIQVTEGNRILWQSPIGKSFVGGARARTNIHENRGSFTFDTEYRHDCNGQSLENWQADDKQITLSGTLRCVRSEVPYQLVLSVNEKGDLAYDLNTGLDVSWLVFKTARDEQFYGGGEQFSHLKLNGRRVPIWVSEQGVGRGAQPITTGANLTAGAGGNAFTTYMAVPVLMSDANRLLFLHNSEYSELDLSYRGLARIETWSPSLSGVIFQKDSLKSVISHYTLYSGRMRVLPDWVYRGAIVGMQGGSDRVRKVWSTLRQQQTPIAAFWLQDWVGQRTTSFGKQLWWSWDLDTRHYPGWQQLNRDLNEAGIRTLAYINPFLVNLPRDLSEYRRGLFQEADRQQLLVKDKKGNNYPLTNTDFKAGLLDLTRPETREWIKGVIQKEVINNGFSGWMADFGEALPTDATLFSGVDPKQYHNRYPQEWAELNREIVDDQPHGSELVFFTRAGFSRSPAYSTLFWEGDQMVSWDKHDGLKSSIIGLLSGGLAGLSYNHSDIGGYTTITNPIRNYHRSEELLARWLELNAFTPVFRSHEGNQPQNNVQVYSSDSTLKQFNHTARIFNALFAYRKSLVIEAAETGLPLVRPMWLEFPRQEEAWRNDGLQFMLGSDLLVIPVTEAETKEVNGWVPEGSWVHLITGEKVTGAGQFKRFSAPIGQPVALMKADSRYLEGIQNRLAELGIGPQ